jgi:hypothetical protein
MTATIGILNEKSLHASLKQWYAKPGDMLEAPLDGYVVDILRGNHVIEIQTGNFASISRKLRALTQHYRVTLVYPIVIERWILQLPSTVHGRPMRRRSPKRFRRDGLFPELVSFPDLLQCMNFSLEVAFIQEEEVRRLKGNPSGLRRASVTIERRLVGVVGRHRFETPSDLWSLIPLGLPEPFQTSHLAHVLSRPRWFAQKVAYCLRKSGASTAIGKECNSIVYSRTSNQELILMTGSGRLMSSAVFAGNNDVTRSSTSSWLSETENRHK